MKQCNVCSETRPLEEFCKDARATNGRNGVCKPCKNTREKAWKAANPEKSAAAKQKSNAKLRKQVGYAEKHATRERAYRSANPERARAAVRRHREKNPEVDATYFAMRRKAVPAWADRASIRTVYAKRKRLEAWLGVKYNVDHIVPLRSKTVCGLHVEANLQILTKQDNQAKGNRTWPDMWE